MKICEKCHLGILDGAVKCACGFKQKVDYQGCQLKYKAIEEDIRERRRKMSEEAKDLLGDKYPDHVEYCRLIATHKPQEGSSKDVASYYIQQIKNQLRGKDFDGAAP